MNDQTIDNPLIHEVCVRHNSLDLFLRNNRKHGSYRILHRLKVYLLILACSFGFIPTNSRDRFLEYRAMCSLGRVIDLRRFHGIIRVPVRA